MTDTTCPDELLARLDRYLRAYRGAFTRLDQAHRAAVIDLKVLPIVFDGNQHIVVVQVG